MTESPSYLTDQELVILWKRINHLLEHGSPKEREMAFFCGLVLATGMRCSEAAKLRLENCFTTPQAVIWLEKKATKTQKARWVGIFPAFREAFIAYIEERKRDTSWRREFVFPGINPNRPIHRRTGWVWWKRIIREAGIPDRPPYEGGVHLGRRTFATWMPHIIFQSPQGPQKMNSEQLSQTLGHTRDMLYQEYQKPIPGRIFPGDEGPEWVEHVANGKEEK